MRIGVFCSGGDAPGMNACVRGAVLAGTAKGHEVVGIRRGYQGLLEQDFWRNSDGGDTLNPGRVHDWAQLGGAYLRSSRSDEFRTEEGQQRAAEILSERNINALIAIGGDGTFSGALALAKQWDGQIIGCPGTIDNDLIGTDYTIGFSTAVQTAVEAVDKIRDTAASHHRMFVIEVMGRHSGYIALYTAIASGADVVAIPETQTDFSSIVDYLKHLKSIGRNSVTMVVAEGDERGGAAEINEQLKAHGCPYQTRTSILGHLQRGGRPTPEDRRRATQIGAGAVEAIINGETGVMIGTTNDQCQSVAFEKTIGAARQVPQNLIDLVNKTMS